MIAPDSVRLLVLHRSNLNERDVEPRQGFAVTRPLRSIADLAVAESTSRDIVEQALIEKFNQCEALH